MILFPRTCPIRLAIWHKMTLAAVESSGYAECTFTI
jgi:hypothetical protein